MFLRGSFPFPLWYERSWTKALFQIRHSPRWLTLPRVWTSLTSVRTLTKIITANFSFLCIKIYVEWMARSGLRVKDHSFTVRYLLAPPFLEKVGAYPRGMKKGKRLWIICSWKYFQIYRGYYVIVTCLSFYGYIVWDLDGVVNKGKSGFTNIVWMN